MTVVTVITIISRILTIIFNNDGAQFLKQKIQKMMNKEHRRLFDFLRLVQSFGMQGQLEAVGIPLLTHSLQSSGHNLGIAVTAALGNLVTSCNWIPRAFSPRDFSLAHCLPPSSLKLSASSLSPQRRRACCSWCT